MTTSIILFLSLLSSIMYLETTIVEAVNKSNKYQLLRFILMILSSTLWSLFYYLTH